MLSKLGTAGDTMVSTLSSNALLTAHAVKQAAGNLALLLINKDPINTIAANISVSGFIPAGNATIYSYAEAHSAIVSWSGGSLGASFAFAVPPYSLATIVLSPTVTPGFTLSALPTSLALTPGSSASSTISVVPSNGFAGSVALTAATVPSGATAVVSPASTTTSTALTLSASSSAPVANGAVTVTGVSGALSSSTTIGVTVGSGSTGGGSGSGPAAFSGRSSVSGPWFDEDDVVVSSPVPITALTLTVSVPATNTAFSNAYNTIGSQVSQSHTNGTTIVTTFELAGGQTISAGSFTFAAQLAGNGTTHDVTTDTWSLTYDSGGATYQQSGNFH